jgi:hypothetical protein
MTCDGCGGRRRFFSGWQRRRSSTPTTPCVRRCSRWSARRRCASWCPRLRRASQQVFQDRVRTVLRSSYSTYYRRMLPPLLAALQFRCNNTAYRPIMDALELLHRYVGVDGKVRFLRTG